MKPANTHLRVIPVLVVIAAIAVLVLGMTLSSRVGQILQPRPDPGHASAGPIITGTVDIPMYPGAQQLLQELTPEMQSGFYMFSIPVSVSLSQAVTFYKDALTAAGWTLTKDALLAGDRPWLEFVWKAADSDAVPTRRYVEMGFQEVSSSKKEIVMWFGPWAEATKPPIYKGAYDIESAWEKYPHGNMNVHVVRFSTNDPAETVEAYYKEIMPKYGWVRANSDIPVSPYKGLDYLGKGSTVVLNIEQRNDHTYVEMRLWGAEVVPDAKDMSK